MEENLDNIIYIKNLIGKRVCIETVDGIKHEGIVYVVDPIYKTVVLVDAIEDVIEIIMKKSVKSLDVVSQLVKEEFATSQQRLDAGTEAAKERLVKWLKHMFINVEIGENRLKVDQHVIIESPYTANDCCCENTIVLDRIRNIIDQMPVHFQ